MSWSTLLAKRWFKAVELLARLWRLEREFDAEETFLLRGLNFCLIIMCVFQLIKIMPLITIHITFVER